MIRNIVFTLGASVLCLTSAPVFADSFGDQTKVVRTDHGKVCIKTPAVTGAIIDRVECHTAQEWARLGIVIERR